MNYTVDTVSELTEERMDKAITHYQRALDQIRTGKASPSLVQDIQVEAWGSKMAMKACGTISTPDPRTLVIQPFDKTTMPAIEKAIMMSGIGITPMNDGNVIRLPMPELTEERRKELVKIVKTKAEDCRIEVRNSRRDGNDYLKKAPKNEGVSEDLCKGLSDDIQNLTNKKIEEIKNMADAKEKELMTV